MSTLIIIPPDDASDAAALFDYVASGAAGTPSQQSRAPLALLPGHATEIVLVVPAQQLSWHQVQLPKGTLGKGFFSGADATRLRAVLDGLLEEELLDDSAQLHFALEPEPQTQAPVWVAVCNRAWLRSVLQTLEQAARPVRRVVPEFSPETLERTLYVIGSADDAQLVFAQSGALQRWPLSAASVALLNWPADQPVVAEPGLAALAEQSFKRSVTIEPSAQRWLQAAASNWDLLQFEFVNSNRDRWWKRSNAALSSFLQAPRWRAARLALLATVVVNLTGLNFWAWQQQAALRHQRQAIRDILTSTFPNVRVVVDAPVQMRKEVAALMQTSGAPSPRDLDRMLAVLGASAPAGALASAIEFSNAELRMRGLRLAAPDARALTAALKRQGYALSVEGDMASVHVAAEP